MRSAYFVVKMQLSPSGEVIENTEEIVSTLTDDNVIHEAEMKHSALKAEGRATRSDFLREAALERKRKSIRPTVPEMPAVRL